MRRQLSPLHWAQSESHWVQGGLTNLSGRGPPTPSPLTSTLGGALSLAGSKGEHPGRARGKSFTIEHDSTLSLHGGDNIIIYLPVATLYLQTTAKGRAYNFGRAQRGKKRENNCTLNLLESSLLPNPGVLTPVSQIRLWTLRKSPLLLNRRGFVSSSAQVLKFVRPVSQGPAHPPKLLLGPGHLWPSGTVSMAT